MNDFNTTNLKNKILNIWYDKKKYIIVFLFIVLLTIGLILIFNKNQNEVDKYSSIESIMAYSAKKYVNNNNIKNDVYLPLNNLNISIDESMNCENISGVLRKKDTYYPYLVCDNYYSSEIKTILEENDKIKEYGFLKGDNPYILSGGNYQEPGYSTEKQYKVNIKNNVIENGVNIIVYSILKDNKYVAELKRIVIADEVVDSSPTIELIGNIVRTLPVGSHYQESGYKATDQIDGNITSKVQISGNVDTSKVGQYIITYAVTNTRQKTTKIERKVIINESEIDLKINHSITPSIVTGKSVMITLKISENGYSKTVLPNGETSTSTSPTYTVYKNGSYEFIIYDKKDNSEVYSVKITNIDSAPPTGNCTVVYENDNSKVSVSAKDISGIKSYEYFVDNTSLLKSTKVTYSFKGYPTDAMIKVTDNSGEVSNIVCQIDNKSPQYLTSGYKFLKHTNGMNYYLYIPKNAEIHEKQPLIVSMHGGSGKSCPKQANGGYYYVPGASKFVSYQHIFRMIRDNNYNPPAIVLAPEETGCRWATETNKVKEIIDSLVKEYKIDMDRISITGHSQGGAGTLDLINKYPDFFSVALPMSPATNGDFENTDFSTPIWIFAGAGEYQKVQDYVKELSANLQAKNRTIRKTILNSGHDTDKYLFLKTDIVNWMIKQKKGQPVIFDENIEKQLGADFHGN